MKNPFEILGVTDQVTEDELYDAYRAARARWEGKKFAPGEEGMEACEKLDEIEEAYRDARDVLRDRRMNERPAAAPQADAFSSSESSKAAEEADYFEKVDYSDVDRLLKEKKWDEAQAQLDKIPVRNAEWHFLQSIIFYAKRWYGDAREQLNLAVQMDPNEKKYADALKNFEAQMKGRVKDERSQSFYSGHDDRSYRSDSGPVYRRGVSPCDVCSSLLCADCCCECMGGDLISCC